MSINPHLDEFMKMFPHEGLTFDDVSLITRFADFLPHETDISTQLSRNVRINIPFLSAAMDTVTEDRMAIAMAMLGGLGIVHKNLNPEQQAECVSKVKHHLNGLIDEPVTFRTDQTLADVREKRRAKGYTFSGFPILDAEDRVAGILTAKDVKFAKNPDDMISNLMTRNVISAPENTTLEEAYEIMMQNKIGKLPLVRDGKLTGLYSFADVRTLTHREAPLFNRDTQHRLRVGAAIGPGDEQRVEILAENDVDVVVIDTAHGHSAGVMDMTRWVKKHYASIDVIAGNIGTGEAAVALRDAGADGVKVGIGPGSICTTRVVAGVGIPQMTAISECARALEDSIPVIADGGIRNSGDVAKALAAGANSVMMGSVLAGTEESPGEKIIYQGRQFVVYRGMGSLDAMRSREGSRQRYGQREAPDDELIPQGIEGMVPFAGTVSKVLTQYSGGLRSSLGYCGCRTVDQLRHEGRFTRISSAGLAEGHAHDVKVTKEAPNYRG